MGAAAEMHIPKQKIEPLEIAPIPPQGRVLQVRTGKIKALGDERSGIFKEEKYGAVFVGTTGLVGDEHVYADHGGVDRAVHQYDPCHYSVWCQEQPPHPDLFEMGGFVENLVATNMTETNVCDGDVFKVGKDVLLQVSEPRNPCYKLNIRFDWPRALNHIQRTGRVGWNYRVLQTG